jgi:hypothetical protein
MSKDEKLGTLEGLCAKESIQRVCVDWLGMSTQLVATDYAEQLRKIYTSVLVSRNDAEIIDKFIKDIHEQYLPGLEERVKETRTDLDQFMKDELAGELRACGISLKVANATIKLTEKGKLALQRIEDELDPNVEVV